MTLTELDNTLRDLWPNAHQFRRQGGNISSLKMMECMNFIPGNCAPHYDEEPERRPATKKFLKDESINFMYGIEEGAALHFIDEQPRSTIRFAQNKNAYKVTFESNKIHERAYQATELK